jgi:hypothetical protein
MTISKLHSHGIHDKKEYDAAIARQTHLTPKQKAALMASPQIPTHDRGEVSPLGGLARRANPGGPWLGRAEPMKTAVRDAIKDIERRKPR